MIGLLLAVMMVLLAACGGNTSSNSGKSDSGSPAPAASPSAAPADSGNAGGAEKKPIKIGMMVDTSGPLAISGQSEIDGLKLYLDSIGYQIDGHKVEVVYEDDGSNPQTALRKYRKLVTSDKIDILVAPVSSAVLYALRDEVEKDKLPMIDVNAAGNELSWSKKSDYVYRISISNWQNGTAGVDYLIKNVGKKAFTIGPDFPAGHEVLASFKHEFEKAGGKVVAEVFPKMGTNDFASYLTQIAEAKPDFVFGFIPDASGIQFLKQYHEFGLEKSVKLTGTLEFADTLEMLPAADAAVGLIAATPYTPWLDNAVNKKFVEAHQKAYGKLPNFFTMEGYDSAIVIEKAVKEAGSADAAALIKVLPGITFDSPRGTIKIDPATHNPIQNFYVGEVVKQDGNNTFKVLETIKEVGMPDQPVK
ncbi:ABC transporter substrate-binding protein [Ferviditalea candida]